jgi:polar amino acid transport system substrate-binding protein
MSTIRLRPSLLLVLVACVATASVAQGRVEDYCSRPIRAALFEYGVLYRSATQDGIDAKLLEILAQRTGCSIESSVMPRARMWNEMRAGQLDLLTGAFPTPERKTYSYMVPYLKSRNLVLLRKSGVPAPQSLADFLAGPWRLGVLRSGQYEKTYSDWMQQLRDKGRLVEAVDAAEQMRFLEKGIVDSILSLPVVFPLYADAAWLDKEVLLQDWAQKEEESVGALMLSRQAFTPAQARNWGQLLATMAQDGTQYRIHRAFLPAKQARDMIYAGPRGLD